jgi:hypothetical protein
MPARAQGVSNIRDGNGNLIRDKGLVSGNVHPRAMVNSSINQGQRPVYAIIGARAHSTVIGRIR